MGTVSGELVVGGIEIRRHNTPNFIKKFQTKLPYTLFGLRLFSKMLKECLENGGYASTFRTKGLQYSAVHVKYTATYDGQTFSFEDKGECERAVQEHGVERTRIQ